MLLGNKFLKISSMTGLEEIEEGMKRKGNRDVEEEPEQWRGMGKKEKGGGVGRRSSEGIDSMLFTKT